VSVEIHRNEVVAIVGESGSGKSTLAKVMVGLLHATAGTVELDGVDIGGFRSGDRRRMQRRVQLIPQDPYSSLDPRRTVGHALAEAIDPWRPDVRRHRARISELLEQVHLPVDSAARLPHEFSGGQRQRVCIARALAVEPELIVADEITSALDLTIQAEILRLLDELRRELGLTMAFISHNLGVVRYLCDRVVVMRRGEVVESGLVEDVFTRPGELYTRQLLDSVPGSASFSID
jgi:ABC-type glutathione transport system ATPase component